VFEPVAELYLPRVRVIAYDHRGTGRSGAWPAPVSVAMLASDAARVLDDRGVAAAHVVGLSMGAAVGLELALRMPSRVKSLVLVGGGTGGPSMVLPAAGESTRVLGELARDSARHRRLWPAAALFSPEFRERYPERVAALTRPFSEHRPPPWSVWWQTIATLCFGRGGDLHRVSAPTLVLHGERDVMSPVANARALAAGIPHSTLCIVPGAGHAVPLECPEEAAVIVLDWVEAHADVLPAASTRRTTLAEQMTRPFELQLGTIRNTRAVLERARSGRRTRR
jgi:pimeloyl-ACP methyl ester carboxylesterase